MRTIHAKDMRSAFNYLRAVTPNVYPPPGPDKEYHMRIKQMARKDLFIFFSLWFLYLYATYKYTEAHPLQVLVVFPFTIVVPVLFLIAYSMVQTKWLRKRRLKERNRELCAIAAESEERYRQRK